MKNIVFVFGFIICIAFSAEANEQLCLGEVCLGDSIDKLKMQTWITGEKLKSINTRDIPDGKTRKLINHSQANFFYITKNKSEEDYKLKPEKEFISKYVLGINDNEKQMLNPYYRAQFFDAIALKIIDNIIACKTTRLTGFKMTNDGNIDSVTIAPLPSTGKFEVDSVHRQFPVMEITQKEALISAIKSKYPSIMSSRETSSVTDGVKWDVSKPIMFWGEWNNAVFLCITKVLRYPSTVGSMSEFQTSLAINLEGKKSPDYDDPLMQNQPCNSSLSQTPKMNID